MVQWVGNVLRGPWSFFLLGFLLHVLPPSSSSSSSPSLCPTGFLLRHHILGEERKGAGPVLSYKCKKSPPLSKYPLNYSCPDLDSLCFRGDWEAERVLKGDGKCDQKSNYCHLLNLTKSCPLGKGDDGMDIG